MTELLTAAQMRAIEQAAIESGDVTGLELMERAGRGVVEAICEEWPELSSTAHRAVVLCGPGNNGGDGFVVARLLQERGWEVEVFFYGDPDKLPLDAKTNYERWLVIGAVGSFDELETSVMQRPPNIFVDAVFGTGLTRPVEGQVAQTLSALDALRTQQGGKLAAIDLPSGICSDSGRSLGMFVAADISVSFHKAKLGHYLAEGPKAGGNTVVKSIGLEGSARPRAEAQRPPMGAVERGPAAPGGFTRLTTTPSPDVFDKSNGSHKFTHGHALILTGGSGKTGAARLAARGALRIGAGLVTLGVPPSAQQEVACQITALMLNRVSDAAALAALLEDERLNALCLGPGLGLQRARELVPAALDGVDTHPTSKRAIVLDADALSAFADAPDALFAMLHDKCVLTPHAGEFKRLFPDIAEQLDEPATKGPAYSKVDATRAAAARAGCVVLFKGPDTVIAAPDGRCSVNAAVYDRAAPWLATAGSGDVLAGFITGLLARSLSPMHAAETAAWLHVECARAFGRGLIAEDLPEMLPRVLSSLAGSAGELL